MHFTERKPVYFELNFTKGSSSKNKLRLFSVMASCLRQAVPGTYDEWRLAPYDAIKPYWVNRFHMDSYIIDLCHA